MPGKADLHAVRIHEREKIHAPLHGAFDQIAEVMQGEIGSDILARVHGELRQYDGSAPSDEEIRNPRPVFRKTDVALFALVGAVGFLHRLQDVHSL